MSYVVIARRWRPQQFDEIVGQEHVAKTLSNAINSGRIAHSYIFTGPRGVGKTTTARILAKAVNCEKGPTAHPCNECPSCVAITKGNSMDVLEIDGASNRGIDEVRNIRENIRYTPTQGKYRIYIIDEVHMLTKEAFNALLKTLEEPPEHALFIFATTEIHRVPTTILSRCQRFDFRRIPLQTIMDHLRKICQTDKIEIEEEALLQIAKKADGSMRDAQSILDQLISFSGDKVTFEDVAQALGIIHQDIYFQITEQIRNQSLKELIETSQEILSSGYDLNEFLLGMEDHFRSLLVVKSTGKTDYIDAADVYREQYRKSAGEFSENDLIGYLNLIGETINQVKNSQHPQLKFEVGLIKMAKMPSSAQVQTILEKLDLLKKKVPPSRVTEQEAPIYRVEPSSASASSADSLQPERIWQQLLARLQKSKPTLATSMEKGRPVQVENSRLLVEFTQVNGFEKKRLEDQVAIIEKTIAEVAPDMQGVQLIFRMDKEEKRPQKAKQETESKEQIIKKLREQGGEVISRAIDELDLEVI